jgi:hypothetical protein
VRAMQLLFRLSVVDFIDLIITSGAFATLRQLDIAVFPFAWNNGQFFMEFYI